MSLNTFIYRVNNVFRGVERTFFGALFGKYPPDDFRLCLDYLPTIQENQPQLPQKSVLDGILDNGFLFAVPKSRRSVEKRLKRKFGHPDYNLKIYLPRQDIRTCHECGDDYVKGELCPTCYKKVIEETKAMQDAIQKELKLEPVEQEVVVMYEGEKDSKPEEFWQGKRIVEMEKPRPQWFTDNLLQKSTQKGAETTDVKPSELG